jgi:hypothetical protein
MSPFPPVAAGAITNITYSQNGMPIPPDQINHALDLVIAGDTDPDWVNLQGVPKMSAHIIGPGLFYQANVAAVATPPPEWTFTVPANTLAADKYYTLVVRHNSPETGLFIGNLQTKPTPPMLAVRPPAAPVIEIGLFSQRSLSGQPFLVVHKDQINATQELAVTGFTDPRWNNLGGTIKIYCRVLGPGLPAEGKEFQVFPTNNDRFWALFVPPGTLQAANKRYLLVVGQEMNSGNDGTFFHTI